MAWFNKKNGYAGTKSKVIVLVLICLIGVYFGLNRWMQQAPPDNGDYIDMSADADHEGKVNFTKSDLTEQKQKLLAKKVRDDIDAKTLKRVKAVTAPTTDFSQPEKFEKLSAGATTSRKLINGDAFSNFPANIGFDGERDFKLGNALFRKLWVSSPSSTTASDGLGPLFNARACQSCHLKDGRGHPPEDSSDAISLLIRLGRPPANDKEQAEIDLLKRLKWGDPVYGGQIQDFAVPGLKSEGKLKITYEEKAITLADGTVVSLRQPYYEIIDLQYGQLSRDTILSPRIAPPMIGLGLVEQIHSGDIIAQADPQDRDKDGISGKVSLVRDSKTGKLTIGRFGWKASKPTIREQTVSAFVNDIGISTPDNLSHYGDCTVAQKQCLAMPTGVQEQLSKAEASKLVLDLVTFYSQHLAVPARRDVNDAEVLLGKKIFYDLNCQSCHRPKFVTRKDASDKTNQFQLIWPYSDFLLHDMGEGLADNLAVGNANGREWRTPPLWGIGLTQTVSGHTFFLHDGRARNLTEAILWHDGEAEKAKTDFTRLNKQERDALLTFLNSL